MDGQVAGGAIVFGGPQNNAYANRQLARDGVENGLPIHFEEGGFIIGNRAFDESDTG